MSGLFNLNASLKVAMPHPLDPFDAIHARDSIVDATLSDDQNELDVLALLMRRKPGPAKSAARAHATVALAANARAACGVVVEVDFYRERAIVALESCASHHLRGSLFRIDARKMPLGMWDVLEVGDAVEFDLAPGDRTGRRARFANPQKRLRGR